MIETKINITRRKGFCFLYLLSNPETMEVRYVGKTVDPRSRYRKHLTQKNNSYKNQWLKSLKKQFLKPKMIIINVFEESIIDTEEKKLIKKLRDKGVRLTNITDGGDGGATTRGCNISTRHKEAISIANKGMIRNDLANFNKINKSKKVAQIDFETNEILNVFSSVSEASKKTKCSKTNISKFASGNIKSSIKKVGGYLWKYI